MNVARVRVAFAIIAIAAIVAANGPSLLPEPAAAQAGLFTEPSGQPDTPPVTSRAVVRERVVDVNFPLFDSMARSGPGTTLNLNLFKAQGALFPDVSLTATGGRVERTSSGQGTIWAGRVADDPYSSVTLVSENGVMAGDVRAHGHVYHIRYTGSGAHVISELDPGAFPPDEGPHPPSVAAGGGVGAARAAVAAAIAAQPTPTRPAASDTAGLPPPKAGATTTPAAPAPSAPVAVADDASQVDIMVVYTAAAATEAGGAAAMNSQVDLAVANMNGAYANSGVTFRARLVFKGQVNYTESGDILTDLNNITAGNISNGSQTVATLRNQFGADVVSLITRSDATACGVGWLMNPASASFASQAFNVVAGYQCATSNFSLAHESGHNMGLCHDWIQNDCTPQVAWGHGYVDPQNRFRDIMSYPQSCNNCPRVQYFSNLVTTFQGNPIGTAHNLPNPADNTAVLNANASIITNWRQCVVAPCSAGPTPTVPPTLTPIPVPGNDNFANATTVSSVPAQFTANTAGATTEAGEPTVFACGGATVGIGKTVWYRWRPTGGGTTTITTAGSNFDTVLAVYTGGAVNALTQVACNDDLPGVSRQSQVSFSAIPGTTYWIQAGGFASTAGTAFGSLVVNFSAPVATPTPTANCSPRPSVSVNTTPVGNGRLQVTITPAAAGNARLLSIQIGNATNALVDVPLTNQTGLGANQTITLPPETLSLTFFVRHAAAGATTVPLTVNDGCGAWPTLVGGGAGAF